MISVGLVHVVLPVIACLLTICAPDAVHRVHFCFLRFVDVRAVVSLASMRFPEQTCLRASGASEV